MYDDKRAIDGRNENQFEFLLLAGGRGNFFQRQTQEFFTETVRSTLRFAATGIHLAVEDPLDKYYRVASRARPLWAPLAEGRDSRELHDNVNPMDLLSPCGHRAFLWPRNVNSTRGTINQVEAHLFCTGFRLRSRASNGSCTDHSVQLQAFFRRMLFFPFTQQTKQRGCI